MTTGPCRRPLAPLLLAVVAACSSGGSTPVVPAPSPATAAVPAVRVEEAPVPSFAGTATGNGWVDGSATSAAGARYFREVAGTRGQPFELHGDVSGDEKDKACGTDWRPSSARSLVTVTPDAGNGTAGFALAATATARRGFWRTKATLSCTTINYTDAQAATMARGQAWITLGGGPEDIDQLVVETSGSTTGEWALSVTDTAGRKFETTQIGSTLIAEVPGAGRYSVAASITARAAAGATKDSMEQRLRASVKVNSLRNALAASIGAAPLRSLQAPVTVTVPSAELAAPMQEALTGYLPCNVKPGCGGKVSDLSVSAVAVRPAGGGAVVELTVSGRKQDPLVVQLTGSTAVEDEALRIPDLRLAAGQPHVAKKRELAAAVALLAARASAVGAPIGPARNAAESAVRSRLPLRMADLCADAPAGPAAFVGTVPAADSTGFVAFFAFTLAPLQPCARSR